MSCRYSPYIAAVRRCLTSVALLFFILLQIDHGAYANAANDQKPAKSSATTHFSAGAKVDADTYDAICYAPKDREHADLCQQWRVAEAAKTQLILTGIGLVFILATLGCTAWAAVAASHAAKAAASSNFITQAQIRAYLAEEGIEFEWAKVGLSQVTAIRTRWTNTGNSPGLACNLQCLIHGLKPDEFGKVVPQSVGALNAQPLGTFDLAIGKSKLVEGAALSPEETEQWLAGDFQLVIHAYATYKDIFGKVWKVETCQSAHHTVRDGKPVVRYKVYPHHNSANYAFDT